MFSTYLDPQSGGYVLVDNKLMVVNSTVSKANRLLCQKIGDDLQYPTLGNPIYNYQRSLQRDDVINAINVCLSPLLNSGEISNIKILNLVLSLTKRWQANIELILPDGSSEPLEWKHKT